MKTTLMVIAATLLVIAAAVSARAISAPLNVTVSNGIVAIADSQNDIGNYGDSTVFAYITADIAAYNGLTSSSLPTPVATISGAPPVKVDNGSFGDSSVEVTLNGMYDYMFLHWGGQSGGWEQLYYIGGLTGTFTFDQPPGGPPLVGGLSFYSDYGPNTVPDGSITVVLLGGALTTLGFIRRKFQAG